MTRDEVKEIKREIIGVIHRTMPSAAVASGWASPVDPKPWVNHVSNLIRYVDRPDNLGCTALTSWLAARGIEAGPAFIRALHDAWIHDGLACESRKVA